MPECRCATRNFSGQVGGGKGVGGVGGFVELGHFDKDFVQNTTGKRGPSGSYSEVFFQGFAGKHFFPPKYYISNRKFNPKVDTIRAFL